MAKNNTFMSICHTFCFNLQKKCTSPQNLIGHQSSRFRQKQAISALYSQIRATAKKK